MRRLVPYLVVALLPFALHPRLFHPDPEERRIFRGDFLSQHYPWKSYALARVKAGQRATVESDAFPGALEGTVERVGLTIGANRFLDTDPAAQSDFRVARVRIRLADPRSVEGMTNLQVRIRILP